MNIGLLVSELEDIEEKRICIGAQKAAADEGITLIIIPGKYLIADESNQDQPFDYQYTALFDYADTTDFDALIIDFERIGSKTTILKKEAFLKKFDKIPILTLSPEEGYTCVNIPESPKDQFEQLGYEAVCDAVFFVKNKDIPPAKAPQIFVHEEKSEEYALSILSEVSYSLLQRKYDSEQSYDVFTTLALKYNIKNCGILFYDNPVRNTLKYPWEMPESISVKSAIIDGSQSISGDKELVVETDKIVSALTGGKAGTYILGDLFVGDLQLGLIITEFIPSILIDHYFDTVINLVTAASRISYLEKELSVTASELYEVQEELARDDSVLDHIGDQDYLTGGLNRRGFFARAYDLLKENFTPGKYAVVAYIHMESLKRINDMFGHEEGDKAVKRIFDILKDVLGDCVYGRIRGDEFAAIVIADDEGKAETMRESMAEQNTKLLSESSRYVNHLQYSICAFSYEDNLSLRDMLKETDESLRSIKGEG